MQNVEQFLESQSPQYLKECYFELEEWRNTSVLKDGKIREMHRKFNLNSTQLYMIGELVYRRLATLYIKNQ